MDVGARAGGLGAPAGRRPTDHRVEAAVLRWRCGPMWGAAQAASCGSLLGSSVCWRSCARARAGRRRA
ncbi:MAG: hypothetical protein ACI9WU_005330 [Myxococcota bacterium]|jgi:hypothetical protein